MRIQRWLGLVVAASMLQLNVRVAYAACEWVDESVPASESVDGRASHHESSSSSAGASASHHHEESSEAVAKTSGTEERERPAELPVSADCCQAMTSCGSSVIVDQTTRPMVGAFAAAPAVAARGKIPHGRITAPEPPPPKA